MHQAPDSGYPGLEKEQQEPNSSMLRLPARTPANSPLAGRQEKPGSSLRLQGGGDEKPVDRR